MEEFVDNVARERIIALDRFVLSELRRLDELMRAHHFADQETDTENKRSLQKFEETVASRFASVNELRGALDDLGKGMATRRELESFKDEYRAAHGVLVSQLGDVRTQIAVGPAELSQLARQQAIQTGRREGLGLSANMIVTILTILIAAGILATAILAH